jgi:hypothetical protein
MMKAIEAKTVHLQTWYGVSATISIGPGFIHWAGWRNFLIPHPPLVNWFLRRGLNENDSYILSVTHEFAHFQSAPLALPYTVGLIALAAGEGLSLLSMVTIIISTHAAWEFLSEILTIIHKRQFYRRCYNGISSISRWVFWISTSVLILLGWIILLF